MRFWNRECKKQISAQRFLAPREIERRRSRLSNATLNGVSLTQWFWASSDRNRFADLLVKEGHGSLPRTFDIISWVLLEYSSRRRVEAFQRYLVWMPKDDPGLVFQSGSPEISASRGRPVAPSNTLQNLHEAFLRPADAPWSRLQLSNNTTTRTNTCALFKGKAARSNCNSGR